MRFSGCRKSVSQPLDLGEGQVFNSSKLTPTPINCLPASPGSRSSVAHASNYALTPRRVHTAVVGSAKSRRKPSGRNRQTSL